MTNHLYALSRPSGRKRIFLQLAYYLYVVGLVTIIISKNARGLIDFPNVLILIFPFLFLTLARPALGLSIFVLYFLTGLKTISPSYGAFLSLSILAEMCLLIALFFQMVTTKRYPQIKGRLPLLIFLYVGCYFVSSLFRGNLFNPDGTGILKGLILIFLIYLLVEYFINSYDNLLLIFRSFLFLSLILFGASLFHILKFGIKPLFFRSPIEKGYLEVIIDVNNLSTLVLMILPFIYYQLMLKKKDFWTTLALICFPLSIFTVILTFSRNGFVALTVVLFMMFFRGKGSLRIWGLFLIIFLIAVLTPSLYWSRMATIPSLHTDSGLMMKLGYINEGLRIIFSHPLIGVGYGNSFTIHNTILQVAADLGLPVLFLFLSIFFITYKMLRKTERYLKNKNLGDVSKLPWLMIVSLAAYLMGGLTISIPLFSPLFLIFALIIAYMNFNINNIKSIQGENCS